MVAMSSMIWLDLEPFSYSAPHSLVQRPNASSYSANSSSKLLEDGNLKACQSVLKTLVKTTYSPCEASQTS